MISHPERELSPALLVQRDYSVAHITGQQTLVAGKAELNGLSDAKLGPVDKLAKCPTDAAGLQDCPGYFGHIELAKPMYHIGFLSTVIKVLRCVSFAGSRLMVSRVSFWTSLRPEIAPPSSQGMTVSS